MNALRADTKDQSPKGGCAVHKKKALLIVDDVELNRALLSEAFNGIYAILEAENGQEALRLLDAHPDGIAAILLDIVMPVMDGFAVLQALNVSGLTKTTPVFLITAENSDETLRRGYELGVVDIINKPFMPEFIRRRISNVIELYENREQLKHVVDEQIIALDEQARQLETQAQKIQETNSVLIDTLSTVIEFRDCESGEHVKRIRSLTSVLLQYILRHYPQLGLQENQISLITDASVMHDVGKISIPDYILNKPGRLTPEEFAIMQEHTIRGCEILESVPRLRESDIYLYCYDICRYHHERWDGRGYPDGLVGDQIPIWAQVVALADVYDALVSVRVYKKAYSHDEAVRMILDGECGVFNPIMIDCFRATAGFIHDTLYASEPEEPKPLYERRKVEMKNEEAK